MKSNLHLTASLIAGFAAAPALAGDGVCSPEEEADGLCFVSPSGFVVEAVTGSNGEFPVVDKNGDSHFAYQITGPGYNGGSCAGVHDISHADILVPDCPGGFNFLMSTPSGGLQPAGQGDPSCGFGAGDFDNQVFKWDHEVGCNESATFGFVIEGTVGADLTDFLLKSATNCDVATILGPSCGPFRYCVANPNSTGVPGFITWSGLPSISENMFYLESGDLPPDQPGWFFMGTEQEMTPFGDGYQCLGGDVVRLQKIQIEISGETDFHLDFTIPPMDQITPGIPWYFQLYYRDPDNGGAGYSTTDGLCVTFAP